MNKIETIRDKYMIKNIYLYSDRKIVRTEIIINVEKKPTDRLYTNNYFRTKNTAL